MKRWLLRCLTVVAGTTMLVALAACQQKPAAVKQKLKDPGFTEVSVHDPSIVKDGNTFYTFGSHMQMAKSTDLIKWTQVSNNVDDQKLFKDIHTELADVFTAAQSDTFWAGDIEHWGGKYYMYYCACQGSNPTAVLGLATADKITGPYTDQGVLLKSGEAQTDPNVAYDATIMPNAIDPQVYFDKTGQLRMVYGSYSGGIFTLKLDKATGKPLPGQGYGKRLLGGNHVRIEGSYMLYNKQTDYYYLFLSFGGLDANGGYNIRVGRSKNPEGPFVDAQGQKFTKIQGPVGSTFDDKAIQKYGVKMMGNHTWDTKKPYKSGYVSPGHNSAIMDAKTGKTFMVFHSRFPGTGEAYEDRVHQLFWTKAGWPVATPLRYGGETIAKYSQKQVLGKYKVIQMNKTITDKITTPKSLTISGNGNVKMAGQKASLKLNASGKESELKLGDKLYHGFFISQWDPNQKAQTMGFTGTDAQGEPVLMVRDVK
ncbi:glycoside hydrolase family 43 protein [Lacticaseibacillus nasuensis]|uniref:glycoside hydrolase family 43 protein n=1 Tax=Lacticaseibacillus nasuensis TaxID=944671 RepID=UPI000AD2DF6C|nr:glycoside hydrolase family 43 protein [Lacticaseibacillus nasuensis]